MANHLETKNLVPFRRRKNGYHMPGMAQDRDERMIQEVDPNLKPEDEGVVRRYLNYADTLLNGPDAAEPGLGNGQGRTAESIELEKTEDSQESDDNKAA